RDIPKIGTGKAGVRIRQRDAVKCVQEIRPNLGRVFFVEAEVLLQAEIFVARSPTAEIRLPDRRRSEGQRGGSARHRYIEVLVGYRIRQAVRVMKRLLI